MSISALNRKGSDCSPLRGSNLFRCFAKTLAMTAITYDTVPLATLGRSRRKKRERPDCSYHLIGMCPCPSSPEASSLKRQIGGLTATSLVVANMIGAGIFTTSGLLAGYLPSSGGSWPPGWRADSSPCRARCATPSWPRACPGRRGVPLPAPPLSSLPGFPHRLDQFHRGVHRAHCRVGHGLLRIPSWAAWTAPPLSGSRRAWPWASLPCSRPSTIGACAWAGACRTGLPSSRSSSSWDWPRPTLGLPGAGPSPSAFYPCPTRRTGRGHGHDAGDVLLLGVERHGLHCRGGAPASEGAAALSHWRHGGGDGALRGHERVRAQGRALYDLGGTIAVVEAAAVRAFGPWMGRGLGLMAGLAPAL